MLVDEIPLNSKLTAENAKFAAIARVALSTIVNDPDFSLDLSEELNVDPDEDGLKLIGRVSLAAISTYLGALCLGMGYTPEQVEALGEFVFSEEH